MSIITYIKSSLLPIVIILAFSINNVLIGYKSLGVSYDRLIELIVFFILLNRIMIDIGRNKYYKHIILFFIAIAVFRGLSILFEVVNNDYSSVDEILREYVRMLYFIIIFAILYYAIYNKIKLIDYYLYMMLLLSFIAFFQSGYTPFTDFFIQLKLDYFNNNTTPEELKGFVAQYGSEGNLSRVVSLYGSVIIFSYALLSAVIVSSYRYISVGKNMYMYMALFFYIVGILTATRSLFLSSSLIISYILWYSRVKFVIVGLALVVSLFVIFYSFESRIFSLNLSQDITTISRVNALTSGLITILEEPFYQLDSTYVDNFYLSCSFYGFDSCGPLISSHNGFINISEELTLVGLFLFLLFIRQLFLIVYRLERPLKYLFSISIFSYLLHSSLHNNIIFISEYTFILPIVLIVIERKKVCNYSRVNNFRSI